MTADHPRAIAAHGNSTGHHGVISDLMIVDRAMAVVLMPRRAIIVRAIVRMVRKARPRRRRSWGK
jgi:hypothetical protein